MAYVVKGTPPGFDVHGAIDYLLSFDSSWTLLKIGDSNTFSGTVTHSLGYPPLHFIAQADGRLDQSAANYAVDATSLARSSGVGTPRYFIFRLDLTTDFTAPLTPGSTTQTTQNDGYVFKITKPGKDTNSTDMRDYALHSNTRSPMIHKVDHGVMTNTGGGLGYERTVSHGLGYTPLAFVFMKPGTNTLGLDANRYGIVEPPVGASSKYYTVDATNVYITADTAAFSAAPTVSVVVLKDPFTRDVVNVSFP